MLTFEYPDQWHAASFEHPSSVSTVMTYLSTEPISNPCVRSGSAILCHSPVDELSEGGVLITWWRWGLHRANPGPDPEAGELIHVGGRSATIKTAAESPLCFDIGAERYVLVQIPDPTLNGTWTRMDVCLRGPDLTAPMAQIDATLASVEWLAPEPSTTIDLTAGSLEYELALYDDTSLVTSAEPLEVATLPGGATEVRAEGNTLEVRWMGGSCRRGPILGLSGTSTELLLIVEPEAGPPSAAPCEPTGVPMGVTLVLESPVEQDAIYVETW